MGKIFRQGGFLFRLLNTLTDVLFLSLLFLFCSMPLVTIGASLTALYDSTVRCVRYKHPAPYRRFFTVLKREWKQSIPTALLWGGIIGACLIFRAMLSDLAAQNAIPAVVPEAYRVLLVLPIGAACWVFPIESRFTQRFRELNGKAFRFSLTFLPRTVVLALLSIECIQLCLDYFFPIFFMPVCLALLFSLFIEPVFKKLGGGLHKYKEEIPEERPDSTGAEA